MKKPLFFVFVVVFSFQLAAQNLLNIQKSNIDNIHVFRDCPSGCNLSLEIDTVGYDEYLLHFNWQLCDPPPPDNWTHWDNGTNFTGIGAACGGCPITVAARWQANTFPEYQGANITKVKIFAYEEVFPACIIKIWAGENADSLIYSEDVTSQITAGAWSEIILATPVPYDVTKELWVGYKGTQGQSSFNFGADAGPAVIGFGDKISMDEILWDNLSDFGLDYNWNIQAYIEDSTNQGYFLNKQNKGISESDNYLNLFRSVNGGEYTLLAELTYTEGQVEYPMPIEADGNLYCYKLTAVYESDTNYCESEPFTTLEDPNIDYVCVLLTGDKKQKAENASSITIFPNPATSQLNIQSEIEIEEITLMNAVGQIVFSEQIQNKEATLNTSGLLSGIYFVKIGTTRGVFNRKVVINH